MRDLMHDALGRDMAVEVDQQRQRLERSEAAGVEVSPKAGARRCGGAKQPARYALPVAELPLP